MGMSQPRRFLLLLAALGLCAAPPTLAQGSTMTAPVVAEQAQPSPVTGRVEHIRIEDAGSRVDEVRAGGETQSITVTPKAPVPPYDVRPADVTRPAAAEAGPGSAGQRTWKVLSF